MLLSDLEKPTVAIVKLHDDTQNPAVLFQVLLDPANVSPTEAHMRFGQPGDEIMGWKRINAIEVIEVLGWPTGLHDAHGAPVIERAPKPESALVVPIAG